MYRVYLWEMHVSISERLLDTVVQCDASSSKQHWHWNISSISNASFVTNPLAHTEGLGVYTRNLPFCCWRLGPLCGYCV